VDSGGPKEAQVQSYLPGGGNGGHTGAIWRIRLNHPSVVAMHAALCQITMTTDHLLLLCLIALFIVEMMVIATSGRVDESNAELHRHLSNRPPNTSSMFVNLSKD